MQPLVSKILPSHENACGYSENCQVARVIHALGMRWNVMPPGHRLYSLFVHQCLSSMHSTLPSKHKHLAIFLIVALLAAQWMGVVHRIAHFKGWSTNQSVSTESARTFPSNWSDQVNHSCAAFDAAAVGSALTGPCLPFAIVPNTHVLALWVAFASWQAPHISHFSSRAPPA